MLQADTCHPCSDSFDINWNTATVLHRTDKNQNAWVKVERVRCGCCARAAPRTRMCGALWRLISWEESGGMCLLGGDEERYPGRGAEGVMKGQLKAGRAGR
jgi:hypothetical protein